MYRKMPCKCPWALEIQWPQLGVGAYEKYQTLTKEQLTRSQTNISWVQLLAKTGSCICCTYMYTRCTCTCSSARYSTDTCRKLVQTDIVGVCYAKSISFSWAVWCQVYMVLLKLAGNWPSTLAVHVHTVTLGWCFPRCTCNRVLWGQESRGVRLRQYPPPP